MWMVIHPETGARLCKDHKWRNFALFGTYSSCVKFYKRKGNAQRVADRFRVNGQTHIICLMEDETMDASGKIWKTIDLGNGMEKTVECSPSAYKRGRI